MPKTIIVPPIELWDEKNECFVRFKQQTLNLEHSLVSISKWESKWHKAFLKKEQKTREQTIDYIKDMCINYSSVDDAIFDYLPNSVVKEIQEYIEDPMTATVFYDESTDGQSRKTITSEIIYSWMIAAQIPVEFQKWHLNRLMTLIRLINEQNQPKKKMSRGEILRRNKALNDARKAQLHTTG